MKKQVLFSLFIAAAMLLLSGSASAVEVTFRVDMSEQTVATEGVHIAGSFQDWDPAATEMTLTQDNIYVYTATLTEGEEIEYKFVNGNAWGMDETVPSGCALNGNRYLTVPASNTELDAFCFGSCVICNPGEVEITFQVDMSNETVSSNGIHLAGSFQGWDPATTEMALISDNIYAITFLLEIGGYYEYKFVNGNAWGDDETVPPECAAGWNRYINVPEISTTLDAVCFGSCNPCGPPPIDINVTFQVDMSEQVISPDGVHIGGGFQGWDPGATEMTLIGDNIYEYTTVLSSGTYQEYKFVNGTTWDESENVPTECGVNNNRFLTVPVNDTIIEAVCYAECGPCGPPPVDVNVTFKVDMSNEDVSADGIHITGTFQGWDPASTPMTDVGDGIYEVTLTLQSGFNHEYKFANGNTFDFVESVPEECGVPDGQGGFNRYFEVPVSDTTMPALCFASCEPCIPPQPEYEFIFRVDMSNETVSADGIHLAGTFQDWNPASTAMTLTTDNIYEVSLMIEAGTNQEFKFINGNTFDFEEDVPETCGVPDGVGGFNRYFTMPAYDTAMTAVCFGSCEPCLPPLPDHAVTFRVDMTYEEVSPNGVHLAGTFQDWNPSATAMSPAGDNIYEVTLILQENSTHEFKYINGDTFEGAEMVPADCSQNGNRYLTVPDNDTTLTAVCFESCDPCGPPPTEVEITFLVDMEFEIVSPEGIHIAGSFQGWEPGTNAMQWMEGTLYAYTTFLSSGDYIEYKFVNGDEWGEDEMVPAECANNNNRYFSVPEENDTLMAVCYAHCVPCNVVGYREMNAGNSSEFAFYPNPASQVLIFNNADHITIFTIDGKLVMDKNLNATYVEVSGLQHGLYYLLIENEYGAKYQKLIIE